MTSTNLIAESSTEAILSVLNDLQTRTCLQFVERTNQKNYINIVSPDENE